VALSPKPHQCYSFGRRSLRQRPVPEHPRTSGTEPLCGHFSQVVLSDHVLWCFTACLDSPALEGAHLGAQMLNCWGHILAKPEMPLTDAQCRNAKCPVQRARARYADSHGLYLEVLPGGGKSGGLKYRFGGKEKRLGLGVYPTVSLARARQEREKSRALLAEGLDPSAARQDARAASAAFAASSFEAVARAWHAQWKAARTDHHADYVLRRLEADVFPQIGARPITEVTAPMLVRVAKLIEARGALDIAKRARTGSPTSGQTRSCRTPPSSPP